MPRRREPWPCHWQAGVSNASPVASWTLRLPLLEETMAKTNLDPYARIFLDAWREGSPKTYREWRREGVLEQKAQAAAERARERVAELVSQGLAPDEAREIAFPMYLYPPRE
ncbi:MAG: hypothetical protein HY321_08790 [Armatimonadetes bacterium]|nr:hypothetical protein [Armatimonadota bacterium]